MKKLKELEIPTECPTCEGKVQIRKIEYECPGCSLKGQVDIDEEGAIESESVFAAHTGDRSFRALNCFPCC